VRLGFLSGSSLTRKNNGLASQRAESTYILARGFSWFSLKTRDNVKYCSQAAGRSKAEKEEKRAW